MLYNRLIEVGPTLHFDLFSSLLDHSKVSLDENNKIKIQSYVLIFSAYYLCF